MIAIMMFLVLAVAATSAGMLYWFFGRLRRIEDELWGAKRAEVAEEAAEEAEAENAEDERNV